MLAGTGHGDGASNSGPVVTRLLGILLLAVIAAALLWSAAEQHYRACLAERHSTPVAPGECSRGPF
jgi:hypothetical protein